MIDIVCYIFTAKQTKISNKVLFREQCQVISRLEVEH